MRAASSHEGGAFSPKWFSLNKVQSASIWELTTFCFKMKAWKSKKNTKENHKEA
jgi:hypothetical protein